MKTLAILATLLFASPTDDRPRVSSAVGPGGVMTSDVIYCADETSSTAPGDCLLSGSAAWYGAGAGVARNGGDLILAAGPATKLVTINNFGAATDGDRYYITTYSMTGGVSTATWTARNGGAGPGEWDCTGSEQTCATNLANLLTVGGPVGVAYTAIACGGDWCILELITDPGTYWIEHEIEDLGPGAPFGVTTGSGVDGGVMIYGPLKIDGSTGAITSSGVDIEVRPGAAKNFDVYLSNIYNAFLVGTARVNESATAFASNGTAVITKALHGLVWLHAGDMVQIVSATTAGDVGFYRIVSFTANNITLDRALAGTDADVAIRTFTNVVATLPPSGGAFGQVVTGYSSANKPLQLGGSTYTADGHGLTAEDLVCAGDFVVKGAEFVDGAETVTGLLTANGSIAVAGDITMSGTADMNGLDDSCWPTLAANTLPDSGIRIMQHAWSQATTAANQKGGNQLVMAGLGSRKTTFVAAGSAGKTVTIVHNTDKVGAASTTTTYTADAGGWSCSAGTNIQCACSLYAKIIAAPVSGWTVQRTDGTCSDATLYWQPDPKTWHLWIYSDAPFTDTAMQDGTVFLGGSLATSFTSCDRGLAVAYGSDTDTGFCPSALGNYELFQVGGSVPLVLSPTWAIVSNVQMSDEGYVQMGTGGVNNVDWQSSSSMDQFMVALNAGSGNALTIAGQTSLGKDCGHADTANPTVFIQGNLDCAAAGANDWLSLAHNQTDAVISTGEGDVNFTPAGGDVNVTGNVSITGQYYGPAVTTYTPAGTTQAIDWDAAGYMTLLDLESATGNVTLTFSNLRPRGTYTLFIRQDGGVNFRNVIFPTTALFPGVAEPYTVVVTATADAIDRVTLSCFDATHCAADVVQDY